MLDIEVYTNYNVSLNNDVIIYKVVISWFSIILVLRDADYWNNMVKR